MKIARLFITPDAWPRIQAPAANPLAAAVTTNPAECLRRVGLHFPDIWPRLDRLRASCLDGTADLPEHWYLPFNAVLPVLDEVLEEMVQAGVTVGTVPGPTVNMLATLAGWRATQGIYRFDRTLLDALIATPMEGKLPTGLLSRLPEWTVYIETPGLRWTNEPLLGVFAQVGSLPDGGEALTLVGHLDHAENCVSGVSIRLGQDTIEESLEAVYFRRAAAGMAIDGLELNTLHHIVPGVISLLLYLSSEAAEVGDGTRQPTRPVPRRTKKGMRMFPAERQTPWDVGVRLGAALRRAVAGEVRPVTKSGNTNASPIPHVRGAHWHTFLRGPRQNPKPVVRWMPPMPINAKSNDDLVPTIRPVVAAAPEARRSLPETEP